MILRMELSATFRGDAILRKLFANGKIFNKQAYFHFKTPSPARRKFHDMQLCTS